MSTAYIPVIAGIETQFVTDRRGKKIAVQFSLEAYEKLLEKLEDTALAAMADAIKKREEETYSLEDVKKHLRKKK